MKKQLWSALTLGASVLLASCGGSSDPTATVPTSKATTPIISANIAVPGSATPPFSFDISYADSGKYFLADRNNSAVDVVDTKSNTLIAQIKGTGTSAFTGFNANTDLAGPDGLVGIPGTNTLYASDVNSIKVIDISTQQVVSTIAVPPLSTAPHRVDEGCYDPDDNLVMFSSPGETPPTATFISTKTNSIVATYQFKTPLSVGLEACVYDSKSKSFLVNNDGTPSNPAGEVNVIAASSVVAKAPVVSKVFPLGACGPTGLELGPNNDMLVGCDSAAGNPLITLILDRTTGATLASIPFGGVDQVAYDAVSNRYFLPARHETASGIAASSGFTPILGVVDASTRKLIDTLAVGTGVHSVAVDGALGHAYVPFQPGVAAFPNGGIHVVTTH
jgi:hypothetical protein